VAVNTARRDSRVDFAQPFPDAHATYLRKRRFPGAPPAARR
jgi:hypothetical protein